MTDFGIDVEAYTAEVTAELEKIRQVMLDTWGYAPDITPKVELLMKVSVDFNLQGFAHDGRSIQVHKDNLHRRGPVKVARELAAEISQHRNTCDRCGDGSIPPLHERLYRVTAGTRIDSEGMIDFWRPKLDEEGKQIGHEYTKGYAYTPPDAVEAYVEPGRAKRLNRLLDQRKEALVAATKQRADAALAREDQLLFGISD